MIHKVFSVYDSKAEVYLPPLFFKTKGEALRAFITTVNDANTDFHKYAEDFCLFDLGSFDDEKAKFDLFLTPISIGKAIEYIKAA